MNRNIWHLFNNFLHPEAPSRENNCGYMEISGAFTGDILNGMNVFVAPSGYIKGNIRTRTLVIAGKVHGNVEACSLVLHSSGELIYNKLIYKELIVEDGGVIICKKDGTGPCGVPPISRSPASAASKEGSPKASAALQESTSVAGTSPYPTKFDTAGSDKEYHFQSSF